MGTFWDYMQRGGPVMWPLLAFSVLMIVSVWKVFVKAGKPGWASLIPIYNIIVLLEVTGKPTWTYAT